MKLKILSTSEEMSGVWSSKSRVPFSTLNSFRRVLSPCTLHFPIDKGGEEVLCCLDMSGRSMKSGRVGVGRWSEAGR
jgi:hypothetical protein